MKLRQIILCVTLIPIALHASLPFNSKSEIKKIKRKIKNHCETTEKKYKEYDRLQQTKTKSYLIRDKNGKTIRLINGSIMDVGQYMTIEGESDGKEYQIVDNCKIHSLSNLYTKKL